MPGTGGGYDRGNASYVQIAGSVGSEAVVLLEAADATGSAETWGGGAAHWWADGEFDGATATLKIKRPDGTTWLDGADGGLSLTAPGGYRVEISASWAVHVEITNAGAATAISSGLSGV